MLIRADILTNSWSQTEIDSGDVTVVTLTGDWGKITILNIYNDCELDHTVELIRDFQRASDESIQEAMRESTHTIWLEDFNRHHPHWDCISDKRLFTSATIRKAEKLISAVADAGLDLALPPKIPMHKHNVSKKWIRLDHVFLSEHSFDLLLSCETLMENLSPNTDHLPVVTKLDMLLTKAPFKVVSNFRNVDWPEFRKALKV